jgi:ribulose-5-phosphate 4-epimerase/fuculose-1-phosphate aldolase
MESLINKYSSKMVASGLAPQDAPLVALLDADIEWNRRNDPCRTILEKVMAGLHINSLIFSELAEPYRTIIDYLAATCAPVIYPQDCETRTFFHDFPVCPELAAPELMRILRQRKNAIVPGKGIVAAGTISPLQAYVSFSSVCFSCFVKFFADYLRMRRSGRTDKKMETAFAKVVNLLEPSVKVADLTLGPFNSPADVVNAVIEAGLATVTSRLVDSFFGNISYLREDILYISQTASSLDELAEAIDAVPLDGSSCVGITASSEYSAHRQIVAGTPYRAILHGHPKFSVILSLDCELEGCKFRGSCHTGCPQEREVCGTAIVPGEIGRGLAGTVPAAIARNPAVIVYGHGVFTAGEVDFNKPLQKLAAVENSCREEFFRRL